MKPARIYRGDTWERAWALKNAAGAAIDLTGASARLQVRDDAGQVVISATAGDGLTITPAEGRIELRIDFADTGLAPGSYRFDLEVTHTDGVRRTYELNVLVVLEDVTHD